MTETVACNALIWVLVVWALVILVGVPADLTAVPGLLLEALAVGLYVRAKRWRR